MTERENRHEILYPLGVTPVGNDTVILFRSRGNDVRLILEKPESERKETDETLKGRGEAVRETIAFEKKNRVGDVWFMTLKNRDLSEYSYCFEVDGKLEADPCARVIAGREKWNDASRVGKPLMARLMTDDFDWGDDENPEIPYSETILYRLHVRGFTKHVSSKVKHRGTYSGVTEKIPYLKELGVTAVELMPATEFDEIMVSGNGVGIHSGQPKPTGVVNYWGYGPSFLYALKAAYGSGEEAPEREFKTLVKTLHQEGMECILELYFTGEEAPGHVVHALRYWVQEYHVDGFHLSGFAPLKMIADDPFLKRTKILAADWGEAADRQQDRGYGAAGEGPVTVHEKNLAECGTKFQDEMRRFLKGDEGMVRSLEFLTRRNPAGCGVINYLASTNGFTMMDLVSYERKHNENNGEENRDGNDYNYSWNCGVEGPTRKKKILDLRRKQLCSGFLLLFLSQGVPMILAGDEFGNSQSGNNNAYCQDNEISWLNWKLLDTNQELFRFVKGLIAFRKAHPVFHMEREPKIMDYKSCGRPDVSYHGENAWRPEYENFRRQFGILYWGPYGTKPDGTVDNSFYVAYNMHWEPHVFGLPRAPKGHLWHVFYDSSMGPAAAAYREGWEPALKNQVQTVIPPRSIMVFGSKPGSGYYVYGTPVGEVTVCCEDGAVTGLHFGRVSPKDGSMEEVRTELSDQVFSQLEEYFSGERESFDLPLEPVGTAFQKKVWNALKKIPFGETRSYKEIAREIGDEKATRAVGMANNKNPIAIVIPCHRVVGADGTLTGYGGGLDIKRRLLELEEKALSKKVSEEEPQKEL